MEFIVGAGKSIQNNNQKLNINILNAEFVLILAGLSFGFVPIISALLRNNSVSSIEQIFMRHLVAGIFSVIALIFALNLHRKDEIASSLQINIQLSYLVQAIIMNLMILVYFVSISLNTPAGEAALFVQIHPITTFIISYFWLKETINRKKVSSLLIAFLGILILLRPWELDSFGHYLIGDLLAMSNGFFYSLYIVTGRKTRELRKNISALTSNSWIMIWAFLAGLIFLFFMSLLPLPSTINSFDLGVYRDSKNFILGIILGLAGSIIPYGLLMIGVPRVESSKAAILLLGEPLGAVIFGFIILQEQITIYYLAGGILLFIAIINITNSKVKNL